MARTSEMPGLASGPIVTANCPGTPWGSVCPRPGGVVFCTAVIAGIRKVQPGNFFHVGAGDRHVKRRALLAAAGEDGKQTGHRHRLRLRSRAVRCAGQRGHCEPVNPRSRFLRAHGN